MNVPTRQTYRIGSINTNRGNRRPLYIAETQETIAWQARRRFPEAFTHEED
jgi:hypothetical protein